ncbi:MAG: SDR family oxidoreductase [Promethearchaeota archaeon]
MKILVIGANGFLGLKILKYAEFDKDTKIIGADIKINLIPNKFEKYTMDITDREDVKKILSKINPDLCILTAAMTNVDACEDKRELAYNINSLAPKYVAETLYSINPEAKLIFISTDFVFDGNKGNYSENDPVNPLSYYGYTKVMAEKFIRESGINFLICRTSVLYGWPAKGQRDNFFSWAYKNLKASNTLNIVSSQVNNPTLCNDLAFAILKLKDFKKSDIIHTCGSEPINRFEFVRKIAEFFKFGLNLVNEIKEFKQKAKRPLNGSMNISKAINKYGLTFHNIEQSFLILKTELELNKF